MIKVLVVENNPIQMELAQEILNPLGFIVHGANNGIEAIKKTEKELYNLILTEIALPSMDGFEVTEKIKSKPRYKNVPIIALTAYAMKGDRENIIACGLDDYIPKPIHVPDFTNKIINWVNNTCPEKPCV